MPGDKYMLFTTDLLLEGVQFDLTYFPLQHLGYKAVVAGISDILAMNGTPRAGDAGTRHLVALFGRNGGAVV